MPGWHFQVMDAAGRSGGLSLRINPCTIRVIASWGGLRFLGMDLFSAILGKRIHIINIYAPYQNRLDFWKLFLDNPMINSTTILGGDLNFSIGHEESWGHHWQLDPLSDQLISMLDQHGLIDVPMNKKMPTWHNKRIGEVDLWRRLDWFLIHEDLLMTLTIFKQWVGSGGISHHSPIYLELVGATTKPQAPYKFNLTWLKDPDYLKMGTDYWESHPLPTERWKAVGFCNNLHHLKQLSIDWAKQNKSREDLAISDLESQIAKLTDE